MTFLDKTSTNEQFKGWFKRLICAHSNTSEKMLISNTLRIKMAPHNGGNSIIALYGKNKKPPFVAKAVSP